jgi:hypothetical protein
MKQIVTMQSLSGRIRRALEKIGLKLIKNSPTNRLAQGDYTLVNFNTGIVQKTHLNMDVRIKFQISAKPSSSSEIALYSNNLNRHP